MNSEQWMVSASDARKRKLIMQGEFVTALPRRTGSLCSAFGLSSQSGSFWGKHPIRCNRALVHPHKNKAATIHQVLVKRHIARLTHYVPGDLFGGRFRVAPESSSLIGVRKLVPNRDLQYQTILDSAICLA